MQPKALRIRKFITQELNLTNTTNIDLTVEKAAIVMRAHGGEKPSSAALVDAITPENVHREIPTGFAVGREHW